MDKVKKILAGILGMDESQVDETVSQSTVESWDSFNHLLIISEIEKQLGIRISIDEVGEIKSYKDIINKIKEI